MSANKVTPQEVQAAIRKVEYTVLQDGRTTVALLTLDNGFTIRGECSRVDIKNSNEQMGQEIALKDATSKVWAFLGFRLADRLHQAKLRKGRGARYRDAVSGIYVTKEYAKLNPDATDRET